MFKASLPAWLLAVACSWTSATAQTTDATKIAFKKSVLDTTFRSEGVAVGDFNHDGKQDIAAGTVWYEAPEWKLRPAGEKPPEYDPLGYSHAFQTFADDLNGDGWTDLIVVDWPGAMTWWLQNPQQAHAPWKQHILTPVTNTESPQFVDIDSDGKLDLLAAFAPDPKDFDGPQRRMAFMTRTSDPFAAWTIHAVSAPAAPSTRRYSHGIGAGDINSDGRKDILCREGWWEAPQASGGDWKFHPAPLGEDCAQMYVFDIDGDGDNDVLSTAAHKVGMWWHEQLGKLDSGKDRSRKESWKTHLIDDSFTQTHALCIADLNGDGLTDFVTGKRWWAHGPNGDLNPGDPAVLLWFELQRSGGRPMWIPHQIDHDSGVGTQFEVADVNGDRLLDVVTSNKKGVRYFEQVRK